MLIRRQAEFALVNLGDLPQPSLEIAAGLVLYAPVLDEASKVMLAICASLPAKVVDVTVESVRTGRLETESEEFLHLRFERIEAHAVDCIFQTSVLSAAVKHVISWNIRPTSSRVLTRAGCRCPAAQA